MDRVISNAWVVRRIGASAFPLNRDRMANALRPTPNVSTVSCVLALLSSKFPVIQVI